MIDRRSVLSLIATGLTLGVTPGARAGVGDRQTVVAMVDAVAAALNKFGFPRALSRNPDLVLRQRDGGLYVFLMDRRGTLLLHPDKRIEGRNVAATTDAHGTRFIQAIIQACTAHPDGVWTSYAWPQGDSQHLATKHTYSRLAGGVIASAGYVATDA